MRAPGLGTTAEIGVPSAAAENADGTVPAAPAPEDTAEAIHRTALIGRINEFEHDPATFVPGPPIEAPPGMPIGDDEDF